MTPLSQERVYCVHSPASGRMPKRFTHCRAEESQACTGALHLQALATTKASLKQRPPVGTCCG